MKRLQFVSVIVGTFFILVFAVLIFCRYLNHHNITLRHPCPTLTMYVPGLKNVDRWLIVTAGIKWYKVKAHRTGKEYFVQFSYYGGNEEYINVMDAIERKRWILLDRRQYNYLFECPAYGKGYAFPYDLKE